MPIRQLQKITFASIIIAGLFSACNMSQGTSMPTLEPGAIYTLAAQTVSAQLTLAAGGTPQPPGETSPTKTLEPSSTPTSADAAQTNPAPPGATPAPGEGLYDHLTFIEDITYPDGAGVSPGETFTKTWRLQNTGTHTWTPGYSLVFDHGDDMGVTASIQFTTKVVEPGEIIDISVELTAPETIGTYQGYWMLRNLEGKLFGCGDTSQPFWVKVDVVTGLDVAFDFNAYADEAAWGTGTTPVGFAGPGTAPLTLGPPANSGDAFADLRNAQTLENGRVSDWVLETYPPPGAASYLIGKYPSYTVNSGEYLKGRVGLVTNPDGSCGNGDLQFQINYTVNEELSSMKPLWEHQETCDGTLHDFQVDLSDLAGKEVQFYLLVIANTSSEDNYAIWDSLAVKR